MYYAIKGFGGHVYDDSDGTSTNTDPTPSQNITAQDFKNGRNSHCGTVNPNKFNISF
jgi:hypothetical protein